MKRLYFVSVLSKEALDLFKSEYVRQGGTLMESATGMGGVAQLFGAALVFKAPESYIIRSLDEETLLKATQILDGKHPYCFESEFGVNPYTVRLSAFSLYDDAAKATSEVTSVLKSEGYDTKNLEVEVVAKLNGCFVEAKSNTDQLMVSRFKHLLKRKSRESRKH
jgi:hypothetical protein